ncbi:MAG: pyridoxamine 5'-phosphate oxidase [Acidimicrobiales bacterium]
MVAPGRALRRGDLDPDPIGQFGRWYADAEAAGQPERDAMALATATLDGVPSLRWVLLKGVGPEGFVFYTNAHSRKGAELAANPVAALGFRWERLERQVRVVGPVEVVGEAESDSYFATRARGSQLGAWASEQSQVIADRVALDARFAEAERRFAGAEIPRPPWWHGWRVRPEEVELWQGRPDRLHDRFRYRRHGEAWVIERLSP